jgi:hypothetical protein
MLHSRAIERYLASTVDSPFLVGTTDIGYLIRLLTLGTEERPNRITGAQPFHDPPLCQFSYPASLHAAPVLNGHFRPAQEERQ